MDNQLLRIKELEEENARLKEELHATKEHLKKYTAPKRSKTFYENHKEEIKEKNKEYIKKTGYKSNPSPDLKYVAL